MEEEIPSGTKWEIWQAQLTNVYIFLLYCKMYTFGNYSHIYIIRPNSNKNEKFLKHTHTHKHISTHNFCTNKINLKSLRFKSSFTDFFFYYTRTHICVCVCVDICLCACFKNFSFMFKLCLWRGYRDAEKEKSLAYWRIPGKKVLHVTRVVTCAYILFDCSYCWLILDTIYILFFVYSNFCRKKVVCKRTLNDFKFILFVQKL